MENKELLLSIKDLLEESNRSLRDDMKIMKDELNARIDSLDKKIDGVKDELGARIDSLDKKIDGVKDELGAKIDGVRDEIISTIRENNVAIADIVTEASEKTEQLLSGKISEITNVTAKNCYDITELRTRAK